MADILILFGEGRDAAGGRVSLRERPGMRGHKIHEMRFAWGQAVLQQPLGRGFAPSTTGGRTIACVGRPTVRGTGVGRDSDAFGAWVHRVASGRSVAECADGVSDALSGMYAIFEISEHSVVVITDHMGFRPVYAARDSAGSLRGLGTHLESLAVATGLDSDIDPVSVGELFAHNYVTFPFTTRNGIRELDPCSVVIVDAIERELRSRVMWEPTEPASFPGRSTIRDRLGSALREAGADLVRDCERVGVLLSGGFDSRAVLAAMPAGCDVTALTYVTRENRETRVASEVSRAAGVDRVAVLRGEDYFPALVGRGLDLIGMELRANCHGVCLFDNGLANSFDVIIGGQLSDTLLKDHFMPLDRRQSLRPVGVREMLRRTVKGPEPAKRAGPGHTTGREAIEAALVPEIRRRVRDRKETRLEVVRKVRPTTADEWHRFWPCSRQDDSAHTLGNSRITCSDTLFAHQAVVDVSREFAPRLRVDGRLTNSVFCELCGVLADIENANTGLPANASPSRIRRDRKSRARGEYSAGAGQDWNDVETSWVNPVVMQRRSAFWVEGRQRLARSCAAEILDGVIARGGKAVLSEYQDDLPSTSNHIAFQLGLWLEGIERRSTETSEPSS
jgi:asparagine synthetase B (glutamine-hydrolysing)